MYAPCEFQSLHWDLMRSIYVEALGLMGEEILNSIGSCSCFHAPVDMPLRHFLMSPFVHFSPAQEQMMLYLKEEGFIQVTLKDRERAITAVLGCVKREYGPQ